ncbi:mechanosensitive ion channel family protein [Eudoraea adriatica]|uniref:mechanosensitive ion channel family protein n=1 Tax=Eudoraea adriatica TaxID=446681 RepID=UPI0003818C27|nr:mechanosensitive ion channel family protein [Eudoraea adriatica]
MKKIHIAFILVFSLILATKVHAVQLLPKTNTDSAKVKENSASSDPLGRTTPRGTVTGLFKSIANEDFERAVEYFDFSAITEKSSDSAVVHMVQKFEVVLNKYGSISPVSIISNNPEGNINDGLRSILEQVGTINLNSNTISILLERIPKTTNEEIWLVSSETTEGLVAYINANPDSYERKPAASGVLFSKWQGAPILDWLLIIALAFASYFIAWLLTLFIRLMVRLFWRNFNQNKYSKFLRALLIPLRLVLAVIVIVNVSRILELSIVVRQGFSVVNLIAMWMALFIFIWLLIDTLSSLGEERLREKNSFGGLSAISFFRNSAKFTLIIIAILIAFDTLGFNVTAGIAALGVGGIALALGAQKTVENIVGGLSVVFDQPVSVGDFCKFGDTLGTVEKIGMRSTRIRTLGRTIVTIPNADFSSQLIENYAKRDMFLYHTNIGLRYETSSDQMRYILVELRKILYAHPKVNPDPARVRFLGYGSDSLNVELFAYVRAADWNEFLGIKEDINLRLAKVIEESGSGFAFPSQTIYLSQDQGLSDSKKTEAEAKVKEWIANNELNIPNFDNQTIESLKGSIKYPPEGSNQPS